MPFQPNSTIHVHLRRGQSSVAHGVRVEVAAVAADDLTSWRDALAHYRRNKAALNTTKKRKNLLSQSPQRKTLLKKPLYLF